MRNEKGQFIKGHASIVKGGKRPNFHGNSGSFKKGVSASPKTQFTKGFVPKNKGTGKIATCHICGVNYLLKKGGMKYCSMPCYLKSKFGNKNGFKKCPPEKHPRWLGGKSFEEYTVNWTNTLKRSIRERDNYTCQVCNKQQNDDAFHVHHVDYEKKNCSPDNLITLCRKCHCKTNTRRDYWKSYFLSRSA